jgi:hypothetical protein
MELDKIKKFLELARKENVAELDYQSNDIKIRVSFKQRSTEIHLPSNNPISVSDSQKKEQKFCVYNIYFLINKDNKKLEILKLRDDLDYFPYLMSTKSMPIVIN